MKLYRVTCMTTRRGRSVEHWHTFIIGQVVTLVRQGKSRYQVELPTGRRVSCRIDELEPVKSV